MEKTIFVVLGGESGFEVTVELETVKPFAYKNEAEAYEAQLRTQGFETIILEHKVTF